MAGSSLQSEEDEESINEIIVKVEMKKFQNLIQNRMAKKNTLVNMDIKRIYPLSKIHQEGVPDGASVAQ